MLCEYNPWSLQPQILSIAIVTIILFAFMMIYNHCLKQQESLPCPKGFVLLVQIVISFIRNLVIEILGKKAEKITPFFLFLFLYIWGSNVICITGLTSPTSSFTITFSLGLIMWFGTFVIGFKYQKLTYLKSFCWCLKIKKKTIPIMINPLQIFSNICPLISMSLRLWGNIFIGGMIVSCWFYFTDYILKKVPFMVVVNVLGSLTAAPFNLYFDLFCGTIQALIFILLTMIYWVLSKSENDIIEMNNNPNIQNL